MPRRILEGEVISDKMDKTITVKVERRTMHPVYKKYIRTSKKYAAHDEKNQFKTGDRVQIVECRPISKRKTWTVLVDGKLPEVVPVKKYSGAATPSKKASAPKSGTPKSAAKKPAAAKKSAKKDA